MKEEIDWKKELLESGKFNNKFSKNILENSAKNYMQEIYMGYIYAIWKQIRGLDLPTIRKSFTDHKQK
ncbi:hypothetical protein HA143_00730 [Prochlorococcus marinus CUG1415]|nr:hypothetical protein [Prochlorococcus marinus CUG1415]MBW3044848.1 hypothetical protein [Prochlorococcus marinus str. MU1415]